MLKKVAAFYKRGVTGTSSALSQIGVVIILIMIILTIADVIGRRFFLACVPGTYELVAFCFMYAALFTWAYAQVQRMHIAITFVTDHLPRKFVAFMNIITTILSILVVILMEWRLWSQAMYLKSTGQVTPELRIPEWPFLGFAVIIGISFFVLALALSISQYVAEVRKK